MLDVVFVAWVVASFALSGLFARACDLL